jgi:hypothetical protein
MPMKWYVSFLLQTVITRTYKVVSTAAAERDRCLLPSINQQAKGRGQSQGGEWLYRPISADKG